MISFLQVMSSNIMYIMHELTKLHLEFASKTPARILPNAFTIQLFESRFINVLKNFLTEPCYLRFCDISDIVQLRENSIKTSTEPFFVVRRILTMAEEVCAFNRHFRHYG